MNTHTNTSTNGNKKVTNHKAPVVTTKGGSTQKPVASVTDETTNFSLLARSRKDAIVKAIQKSYPEMKCAKIRERIMKKFVEVGYEDVYYSIERLRVQSNKK